MNLLTRDVPPRSAWALEQAGIHPLLARLYAARGVQSKDELDDALNLLRQPGLVGAGEYNFLLKGPIASLELEAYTTHFQILTQAPSEPYEYYLGLDFANSG